MNLPREAVGNRAVSALFRVFGGAGRREFADGFERTKFRAMHNGERLVLGVIVPLTVASALSEWLVKGLGAIAGWLLVMPTAFVVLNLLAFFLPGVRVNVQWRVWLFSLSAWAWWRLDAPAHVAIFAWLWLGILALNVAAAGLLSIGKLLRISGRPGIVWRSVILVVPHLVALALGWQYGWAWAVLGGAVIAGLYCAAVLNPYCKWLGPMICHRDQREILITIDDGPHPQETPRLLDLLDEHGARAIFFLIGDKVRQYPELAREIVRRGHEIGNHTMTHPQGSFWAAGPARTWREIEECQRAVFEITGETPRWFRAPVGHRNLFTHPIANAFGLKVMAWSRRGFDAIQKDPKIVIDRILPLASGDIVLMHEGNGIASEVLSAILDADEGK